MRIQRDLVAPLHDSGTCQILCYTEVSDAAVKNTKYSGDMVQCANTSWLA
jgi:hypothetical protein